MNEKLLTALIAITTGALGYLFTTFWMRPVIRYGELQSKVLADLIFYAQVVNADGLNERMQKLYEQRVEANRKLSAELTTCYLELPAWYKWWLRRKGHLPERAATDLWVSQTPASTTPRDAVSRESRLLWASIQKSCEWNRTMRCSRRRGPPSRFQALLPGAADLVSLG